MGTLTLSRQKGIYACLCLMLCWGLAGQAQPQNLGAHDQLLAASQLADNTGVITERTEPDYHGILPQLPHFNANKAPSFVIHNGGSERTTLDFDAWPQTRAPPR